MKILETERTESGEIGETDSAFIFDLLNQPSFIRYIGNGNLKTGAKATNYIKNRLRQSCTENGFGLYLVVLKEDRVSASIYVLVKRNSLPAADVGFAFLPQFEKEGFAFETAKAVLDYAKPNLGIEKLLVITTPDNESSIRLLEKLGFEFENLIKLTPE